MSYKTIQQLLEDKAHKQLRKDIEDAITPLSKKAYGETYKLEVHTNVVDTNENKTTIRIRWADLKDQLSQQIFNNLIGNTIKIETDNFLSEIENLKQENENLKARLDELGV